MILMFRDFDYENKPVVDIVNEMIIDAINRNASDIHFDPTEEALNVRIRIDGELLEYAKVPNFVKKNLLTRIKIISGMNITETRLPQDGAIKNLTQDIDLDLRVSSLPIVDGEKIVIRILNYKMSSSGLENLGLTESNLNKIKKLISLPNGIIMVAGATGSGKSTTVYAALQILNTVERNIITVEDPVEMKIPGINQVQVMSEIGLTFGNTLRSILRQDPDVIMIGEIRDNETARIAVRASITGHLVLSTIHTNNSLTTIERLLDMDVERYLLGSALTGIISQRLVKRLCPKCRSERETTPYEKILFKEALGKEVEKIYVPNGCNDCIHGYLGRIAIHEVLILNQDIRDAIVNNAPKPQLRKIVYKDSDVTSLLQDGLEKVVEGITSIEEIFRVIDVEDDIDEDDVELKNAFIGKINGVNENTQTEETNENAPQEEATSNVEVNENVASEVTNAETVETVSQENQATSAEPTDNIVSDAETTNVESVENISQETPVSNQELAENATPVAAPTNLEPTESISQEPASTNVETIENITSEATQTNTEPVENIVQETPTETVSPEAPTNSEETLENVTPTEPVESIENIAPVEENSNMEVLDNSTIEAL